MKEKMNRVQFREYDRACCLPAKKALLMERAAFNLSDCRICPRNCDKNRAGNARGFCLASGEKVMLSRAALHFYEEPCISGTRGSGAVFFSGCSLRCLYCQNLEISRMRIGREVSVSRLSEIFLELQEKGAHNINLVTPTHYALQIREAVLESRENGLSIPIVWNTSGYEKAETLAALSDVVDIYLTDFKYMDKKLAADFSMAPDYPERAKEALLEMLREKPRCVYDSEGMMQSGVIVRHLVLPGHVKNTRAVLAYLSGLGKEHFVLSLMSQYTPVRKIERYPELNRRLTKREYEKAVDAALSLGFTDALIQEGGAAEESFIPAFDYEGV